MGEFTNRLLRKIFRFLFIDHATGFFRLCMVLLIPTVISHAFCRAWMVVLVFLQTLVLWARLKGWDKEG